MDRDRNPAAAKTEFHLEVRFPGSVALPRPLELGLVNQLAEFRYEPLHCNHPARRVITPSFEVPAWFFSGSSYEPAPASTGAFGQALSRKHGALLLG